MNLNWYAVYTTPRAEKKAFAELAAKGIDAYLPLQRILKQWSDRKKWVEEPLFRSYLFVRISAKEYFDVLNTPGIVRYITFEGKAVPVPQNQIDAIRYFLAEDPGDVLQYNEDGSERFVPGTIVEIRRGAMRGLLGEITESAGRYKVRVEITAIGQSIQVTVPFSNLKRLTAL